MFISDETVLMESEPIPGWEPNDIKEWYGLHHTEAGLAQAFAAVSNKFFWVEDNEYDYEEGTPEHQEACRITDAWAELMDNLQEEIFTILRSEGVIIPEAGQITVLIPFMERNGFSDRNGWWVAEDQ